MKRIAVAVIIAGVLFACKSGDKKDSPLTEKEKLLQDSLRYAEKQKALGDTANYTSLTWLDSTFIDMGKVKEGQVVEVSFRFKNTGNKPLVIADVTASCGCTVPEKPEQPFAPGEEGVIKAKFDSKGRPGENRKHISVDANTSPSRSHSLDFRVEVSN
jgi:hypothetical protein